MKRFLFLLVASLALCVGQADAQRCLPKMRGVELKAGMADGFYSHSNRDDAGYCFGAALATYTKGGNKWVFGGEYLQRYNPYKESRIPTAQFTAEGGFYYNFLSDARKIFFVYIGGSALAGYEGAVRRLASCEQGCLHLRRGDLARSGSLPRRPHRPYGEPPRAVLVGRLDRAFPHAVRDRTEIHHQLGGQYGIVGIIFRDRRFQYGIAGRRIFL